MTWNVGQRKREVWQLNNAIHWPNGIRRRVIYWDVNDCWGIAFEEDQDRVGEPDVTSLENLVKYGWRPA